MERSKIPSTNMKQSVYIIGSKGIPAKYGGFETFVEKLTEYQKTSDIRYYVACMRENSLKSNVFEDIFEHNGATCFSIDVPNIGPARAIVYDLLALKKAIAMSKVNQDKQPIFYILACRIGPFIHHFKKQIHQMGGQLFVNPDGHEWLREKWSRPVRRYWKISESLMVKHADLLICDSQNIERYIQQNYAQYSPQTVYIAYGTELETSKLSSSDDKVRRWFSEKGTAENEYYLVVGRFVPENNYESMLREFMKSNSSKDLVLITNVEKNAFYEKLKAETGFDKDSRVKFVGTVYDQELLKYIREHAFGYFHGHEVGGTNPSLLEALSSTKLNILLDVGFNREVGAEGAIYWEKDNLHQVIDESEKLSEVEIQKMDYLSTEQVKRRFTWDFIVDEYEKLLLNNGSKESKMKRVITYGTFDLLHYGHINLLKRAKALGDYLIVVISSDEFNWIEKQKKCYFNYEQRKALVEAIRYVDLVIPETSWEQKKSDVHEYHIDTFVMGDDWKGKFDFLKEEGVEVVYLSRTPEISTTQIKEDLNK